MLLDCADAQLCALCSRTAGRQRSCGRSVLARSAHTTEANRGSSAVRSALGCPGAGECKQLTWVNCRILGDPNIQTSCRAGDVRAMAVAVCCGHAIKGVARAHS